MTKKAWWQLPYVPLVLASTLIWGGGSTWWYVCKTEQLCDSTKVAAPSVSNPVTDVKSDVPAPVESTPSVPSMLKVYFLPDSTDKLESPDYTKIVDYLKAVKSAKVLVTGFMANVDTANDVGDLSSARSEAVRQDLVSLGVPEDQIKTESKGADQKATGDDETVVATGRRVEVSIIK